MRMMVLGLVAIVLGERPLHAAIKVACVGDSITLGRRATTPMKTYPALLGARLGPAYEVGNFGIGGATALRRGSTPYVTTTGYPASDAFMPNVVVMMFGSNDSNASSWANRADFDADYKALIAHYRGLPSKPQVFAALPPPAYEQGNVGVRPGVLTNEVVPAIKKAAADTGTAVIDVYTALSGVPQDFIDLVHPNDDGNLKIANAVYAALIVATMPDAGVDAVSVIDAGGGGADLASAETPVMMPPPPPPPPPGMDARASEMPSGGSSQPPDGAAHDTGAAPSASSSSSGCAVPGRGGVSLGGVILVALNLVALNLVAPNLVALILARRRRRQRP